jgi:hypothetical protein
MHFALIAKGESNLHDNAFHAQHFHTKTPKQLFGIMLSVLP